ncbi:MAG: winged helix-turn-helix domain-containing protein [Methylocystis sp.]
MNYCPGILKTHNGARWTLTQIGNYISQEFGVAYESRSGLIALLHRLGL